SQGGQYHRNGGQHRRNIQDIAENGKIAVEKLKEKSYDIVLMDLQMPEMNGFEATDYIRNTLQSKIPIIALTADVTTADVEKCRASGMDDYISKPINEKLLYKKIVGLVKKSNEIAAEQQVEKVQSSKNRCTDLNYLAQHTKSNPAFMGEIISAYLDQTPPLVSMMKQSYHDEKWDDLYAAVHKLIPSFAIMGMDKNFEQTARKIMEHARSRQKEHDLLDNITMIESICLRACEELMLELK
ncbi:MAG: response regulator, partial [Saprospiraceae bacterium]